MSLFTKLARDIFPPVDAAGNPRPVQNIDVQVWGTEVERILAAYQAGGGIVFPDLDTANASLAYNANQMAWVMGDPTPANNGIYRKIGASGSGSWVRLGDLPFSMIRLDNAGAGTADAIVATPMLPLPTTPGAALLTVNIVADNTGPVTINDKPLRTNANGPVPAGLLRTGMLVIFMDMGDHYRMAFFGDADAAAAYVEQIAALLGNIPEYVDKARQWANAPEDTEVETGEYSALHFAAKALSQGDRSEAEANRSEVEADRAETARDAAFVNANVYADIATGRAAVTDGQQFQVVSGREIIRYRRDSSSTQTEVARYPSAFVGRSVNVLLNQANIIDRYTDTLSPLFVNTALFTKGPGNVTTYSTATIVSRDSDTQFTVAAGHGARLGAATRALVLRDDDTGLYRSFQIKSNASDVITIFGGPLPATISEAQHMHDSNNGQHLSRFGYLGLADFIIEQAEKYAYKKDGPLLAYNPAICSTTGYADGNIWNLSATQILIPVTRIGGATGGGIVPGTTNLIRLCQQRDAVINQENAGMVSYLQRFYIIQNAAAGAGMEIKIPVNKLDGFLEVIVSAARQTYDTTLITEGDARLVVLADGVTIHDETYGDGLLHLVNIDFSDAEELTVQLTLAASVPSSIRLESLAAYAKSPRTPVSSLFVDGDVIAFLGDSWTQFPGAIDGEVKPLRPDGSESEGMQFLSERIRERLADEGVNVTTLNMGKSGTTSAWGRYWVNEIIELSPRPTKCVLFFGINDNNSHASAESSADTAYDFDPDNIWNFLPKSSGGRHGAVTRAQWFENTKEICARLIAAGIKPIVLMPPHTASNAQSQNMQREMLARMAFGFEPIYSEGGLT